MPRVLKWTIVLVLVAAAFAGCGGDDENGDAGAPTAVETTPTETAPADTTAVETTPEEPADPDDTGLEPVDFNDVTLTEFEVEVQKVGFPTQGVYTFVVANEGSTRHALAVEGPNGETETEEIPPGGSAELDAYLVSGTYKLYCPIGDHEQRGMVARLRVRN